MNPYVLVAESILIVVPVAMIILELFLSFNKVKGDTISGILTSWAYGKSFFITLSWGILTGHFFLGSKYPLIANNTISVVVIAVLLIVVGVFGPRLLKREKTTWMFQMAMLIAGTLIGHLLWSMNDLS